MGYEIPWVQFNLQYIDAVFYYWTINRKWEVYRSLVKLTENKVKLKKTTWRLLWMRLKNVFVWI